MAGMSRAHVTLARLPAARIPSPITPTCWRRVGLLLSGRGVAEIDGQATRSGRATSWAFQALCASISSRTRSRTNWVYMMGGENKPLDVLDYPTLGKRYLLIGSAGGTEFYELGAPISRSAPPSLFAIARESGIMPAVLSACGHKRWRMASSRSGSPRR